MSGCTNCHHDSLFAGTSLHSVFGSKSGGPHEEISRSEKSNSFDLETYLGEDRFKLRMAYDTFVRRLISRVSIFCQLAYVF